VPDIAWTDASIPANRQSKQSTIRLGSDEYFKLLKDHPELARWLALGSQIDVQVGDTTVSVR
jgi:hypothetical protein